MSLSRTACFRYGISTHIGRKSRNEDRSWLRVGTDQEGNEYGIAIVADGMGGMHDGDTASETVVQALKGWLDEHVHVHALFGETNAFGRIGGHLHNFFFEAQQLLRSEQHSRGNKMGTTMTVLFLYKREYAVIHIGDSRVYRVNTATRTLRQLTEDHAWVAEQVRLGQMTQEEARMHPRRNVLLQCIGMDGGIEPYLQTGTYGRHELFLLCTDGFYHSFTDRELLETVLKAQAAARDYQELCSFLVEQAYSRGAADNVTLLAVEPEAPLLPRWLRWSGIRRR